MKKAFDNNAKGLEKANLKAIINCKAQITELEQEKINTLIKEINDKCDTITITIGTDPKDCQSQLDYITPYQNTTMETFRELVIGTLDGKVFQITFIRLAII